MIVIYMQCTIDYLNSIGAHIPIKNQEVNWRDNYVVLTDINTDNNGG